MTTLNSGRPGGPREARLKKKGLLVPTVESFYTVRLSHLPKRVTSQDIRDRFSLFGEIFALGIPENLDNHEQKGFAFVTFKREEDANRCVDEVHQTEFMGHIIRAVHARQESFFTQDTGYITNESLDHVAESVGEFDSSMPANHYEVKYLNRPLDQRTLHTVKVDNLAPNMTDKELRIIFNQFGEVASCHRPMKLDTKQYYPFAFVKYQSEEEAARAAAIMDHEWVEGHELFVSVVKQRSWWSMDESTEQGKQKKK